MDPVRQAFEVLWRHHAATVLRYAARRVTAADVDDVVAETFLVAWRRADEVPDPPLPWLLGVARGVAANATRSAHRRAALAERVAAEPVRAAPPADAVAAQRPSDSMLAALARLSHGDRELLTLIAWDGLTPDEAAEAVGCSRATLAVRLHRARTRLRTHLTDLSGQPSPPADPAILAVPGPSAPEGVDTP